MTIGFLVTSLSNALLQLALGSAKVLPVLSSAEHFFMSTQFNFPQEESDQM